MPQVFFFSVGPLYWKMGKENNCLEGRGRRRRNNVEVSPQPRELCNFKLRLPLHFFLSPLSFPPLSISFSLTTHGTWLFFINLTVSSFFFFCMWKNPSIPSPRQGQLFDHSTAKDDSFWPNKTFLETLLTYHNAYPNNGTQLYFHLLC